MIFVLVFYDLFWFCICEFFENEVGRVWLVWSKGMVNVCGGFKMGVCSEGGFLSWEVMGFNLFECFLVECLVFGVLVWYSYWMWVEFWYVILSCGCLEIEWLFIC